MGTSPPRGARVSFQEHLELLRLFLAHREEIVESIEALLNAQRKPIHYLQDRPLLSRHFEDCFFAHTAVTASQRGLRSQLEEAYWAAGFRPRHVDYTHNDLVHPAEMMIRGFHCWQQTQWPGRNGRMHYAQMLFNLYVARWLEFMSMRLWDDPESGASGRLAELQSLLDALWSGSPDDQSVFVRDARWLIPLAQSLVTDELAPYLEIAGRVRETLPEADALEIQKAQVRMLGGHLTSQIRYYCTRDRLSISERSVVLRTRTSNALDFALLVQGLVALLRTYDCALLNGDEPMRIDMAGAICQGLSADPELFLNRIDLLSAYCMMEHVFIATDEEGHITYSPLGERHVQLIKEYRALIERLTPSLLDDAPRFRPVAGCFSPYGVLFGIPSNLIEHMALKSLQRDADTRFSLEDIFDDRDTGAAKLAWVNGWRNLPHIDRAVQRVYEYPQQFAEDIYARLEHELRRHDSNGDEYAGWKTGHLYLVTESNSESAIPELPARYFGPSDEQAQLLRERREGHFLVSYQAPGGWIALRKELLTDVLGEGCDARIVGVPPGAARVLQLMATDLLCVD